MRLARGQGLSEIKVRFRAISNRRIIYILEAMAPYFLSSVIYQVHHTVKVFIKTLLV